MSSDQITHVELEVYTMPTFRMAFDKQRLTVLGAAIVCIMFSVFSRSSAGDPADIAEISWLFYAGFAVIGIVRVVVSTFRREKRFNWWLYTTVMLMSPLWMHGILVPMIKQAIH